MANGSSKGWWSASRPGNRLGVSCALLVVSVLSLGAETSPPKATLLKSGLHTFSAGRLVVVTFVETGSTTAVSEVRIEARDAAEQKRGYAIGRLSRGKPVRLRLQLSASSGLLPLRFIVLQTALVNGDLSAPVVTLEEINTTSLRVETRPPSCAPPSVGGGAEAMCEGWRVSSFTLDQPVPPGTADVE